MRLAVAAPVLGGAVLGGAVLGGATATSAMAACPLTPAVGVTCINGGGAKSASAATSAEFAQYSAVNPGFGFSYVGTPSIAGQNAFAFNDPAYFLTNVARNAYTVHYATSDAYVDPDSPLLNYGRATTDGPYIQIPVIAIPVAIQFVNAHFTTNGLPLTDGDLCGIFSGKITRWEQTSAKTKTAAGQISVYYRKDSTGAGTTFLLTQHLAAVCNANNSAITFTPTNYFAQLFGVTKADANGFWNMPGSYTNFVGANGLTGEAGGILAATSAIGYISPDYTSIASTPVSATYKSIRVASLMNQNELISYTPSIFATTRAIQNPGSVVNANAPTSKSAAALQTNWVPHIVNPAKGYPVVGYTN
jgi:ABC-type phosphate transport system substrate-binding protein